MYFTGEDTTADNSAEIKGSRFFGAKKIGISPPPVLPRPLFKALSIPCYFIKHGLLIAFYGVVLCGLVAFIVQHLNSVYP